MGGVGRVRRAYWRPRSSAELRRRIAATAGPGLASEYALVIVEDGILLGECSVHGIDWRNRVAQVAVCIWRPADRGRGRGPERPATANVLGHRLPGLVRRLEAWILDGNEPSLRMVESLGFAREGTLRDRYLDGGQWRDMHVLAYLAEA